MRVEFFVNERPVALETEPDRRLIDLLREELGLTGTKEGCGEGECGACTVLLDGEAVHACLTAAIQLEGKHVTTIEGLAETGELDALQTAFVEEGAIQCPNCREKFALDLSDDCCCGDDDCGCEDHKDEE